jgi:hypothetical protein
MSKSNPLAAAWTWSTRHSPLLHAAHWLTRRNRCDPAGLIRDAQLPDAPAERITAIVRATRLWKSERADIARELIAHAHDALSAGRTPEDTADSLGDPAIVAKLLRRSARRKRPWHWQARHRTLQAIAIALLATIGAYTILFIRFNTGSPSITHNYIAELNERNAAFSDDQHALPAFEALHRVWSPMFRELLNFYTHDQNENELPQHATERFPYAPSHARGYAELVAAHARVRPQIDDALAASRLPTLGILYSDRYEQVTNENGTIEYKMLPPTEDPALGGNLVEVLLPWITHARSNAKLIAFDAVLAARDNNPDRAAESLTAIFNTARLIGQEHTLISSLVAIAIQTMGETVLLQIIHDLPNLFDESHLTAIAHTAAVSGRTARDLDFATERRMFGDFLQRAYTDDGHGDGRLTAEGIRLAVLMNGVMPGEPDDIARTDILPVRFTGPVAMLAFGSRRDQREFHASLMNLAEALLATTPGSPEQQRLLEEVQVLEHELGTNPRMRMAAILTPAFTRAVATAHRAHAHTNATLTTIALHIHHQRTGRWPDTLAELTPQLLPTIPEDPFDPGRPIKYRLIDNTPHVYFVGADAIDNNATRPTDKAERDVSSLDLRHAGDFTTKPNVRDTDWVIFPPRSSTEKP